MLSQETIDMVRLLHRLGHSQRDIARTLRIGRNQIKAILAGTRPDYDAIRRSRRSARVVERYRCSSCGNVVWLSPCLVCKARAVRIRIGRLPESRRWDVVELIEPELAPDEHARYCEVREIKIRLGESSSNLLTALLNDVLQGENLMNAIDYTRLIRWFLQHLTELMPLLELPDLLAEAPTLRKKWEILKWAGDRLVGLIEQIPAPSQVQAQSLEALQEEVEANGLPWDQLLTLLPIIIRLVELIRGRSFDDE